jgi:hypothetical protein
MMEGMPVMEITNDDEDSVSTPKLNGQMNGKITSNTYA